MHMWSGLYQSDDFRCYHNNRQWNYNYSYIPSLPLINLMKMHTDTQVRWVCIWLGIMFSALETIPDKQIIWLINNLSENLGNQILWNNMVYISNKMLRQSKETYNLVL
jgi:hypothetical protein